MHAQCGTMELESALLSSWWGRDRIQERCPRKTDLSCALNAEKAFINTKQIKVGVYNFKNQQKEKNDWKNKWLKKQQMKRRQEKKDKEIYQTDGTGRKHKVKW